MTTAAVFLQTLAYAAIAATLALTILLAIANATNQPPKRLTIAAAAIITVTAVTASGIWFLASTATASIVIARIP